jgi:hypothetical protein
VRNTATVFCPYAAQNLRRGHYELGHDVSPAFRVAAALTELARAI